MSWRKEKIFDPDAFLDELAQQWHPLPPSTPQTSTAPFRNPSPPPQGSKEIMYSERYFTKERDQHSVRPLGVLQMPCPKLLCQLWCGQSRVLLRLSQTSTSQLLSVQTRAHHGVLLQSSIDHVHVPVREESREIILKMP